MNNRDQGIVYFKRRLAISIRDSVLHLVTNPEKVARDKGIPLAEFGPIAELNDHQRIALAQTIANALDEGVRHFFHGFDNQADGFEIRYKGDLLNPEGLYLLNEEDNHISKDSNFDEHGAPR